MNDKKLIDYFNDDNFRNNLESGITGIVAIFIVIITKGFMNGFSWDLFFTLEPYASGLGVAIASSLVQNNMLVRGFVDEVDNNKDIETELIEVEKLDKQIKDYDYAEYFCENYNKNEYDRLQKIETEKQSRKLKYIISVKRSAGRKYIKQQKKLDYIKEYGASVSKYKPVTVQDLLSFGNDEELKGASKINFKPVETQRKKLARSKFILFLASGLVAGLPLVGGDVKETLLFLAIWIPTLVVNAFKVYANTRRVTKTTYYKSLQYKKNVLELCVDSYKHYTPPVEEFKDNEVVEVLQIKEKTTN